MNNGLEPFRELLERCVAHYTRSADRRRMSRWLEGMLADVLRTALFGACNDKGDQLTVPELEKRITDYIPDPELRRCYMATARALVTQAQKYPTHSA